MLRTNLCDQMQFEHCATGEITLHLADAEGAAANDRFPLDDTNLILRAANALREYTGTERGAEISINKRIPAEAGLAGGSSNAATTLLGLNRLWDLQLPRLELHSLAASLGSDVNFFIEECSAAVCLGRGEIVKPFHAIGPLFFVAARPHTGCSTPEVFAGLDLNFEPRCSAALLESLRTGCREELVRSSFNRLTESAQRLNPVMGDLMKQMSAVCDRPSFMSGSGSTCYVVATSQREARRLLSRLSCLDVSFLGVLRV